MDPELEFRPGDSFIDPDTAICHALTILEHPFPTQFDTFPSEDPKLEIHCEIGGGDFNHDLNLLSAVPVDFPSMRWLEQIRWAEGAIAKARTEGLKGCSAIRIAAVFSKGNRASRIDGDPVRRFSAWSSRKPCSQLCLESTAPKRLS